MEVRVAKRIDTADELTLEIEVAPAAVDEFVEQGYMAVAAQRDVRPEAGESLADACKRVLTEQTAGQLLTNAVMNMSYPFARSEVTDVSTVGSPVFIVYAPVEAGRQFSYSARWAKLPRYELSSYDPVQIKAPEKRASEEMIDQQITQMLAANARFERTQEKHPVKSGDVVSLALRTTQGGREVEGLCFDERTYTTGVGAMPDEFERNIEGMVPGESKHFTFQGVADFDEDDNPIMDTYEADATLICLMKQIIPEPTDAWVKATIPGCSTVNALRESIRSQLDEQLEGEYRHYLNYVAASALAERFDGRIPDAAYEAMRDELQAQANQEAAAQGLTIEEYMRQQGADEQQYSVRMILQIRERLAQSIALDAFARHEGLTVEEADLDEFFTASAPAGAEAQLRRQLEDSGRMYMAYEGALRLKANDLLVRNAILV